ncbi:hypothetical protein ZWY2020_049333 [Hordeum vulgare]|nr:hypothetical protein ZWY2020_049333 [Hordeum vulgare]
MRMSPTAPPPRKQSLVLRSTAPGSSVLSQLVFGGVTGLSHTPLPPLMHHHPHPGLLRSGAFGVRFEHARWLDDHQRHINNLRVAVIADISDDELRILVESVLLHHDEFFRLKNLATKADVFHVLSGMWMSPAERFFAVLRGSARRRSLKVGIPASSIHCNPDLERP